ncbi:hypothetical protein [Iningainema tapete]|uniref:Mobilization protein MobC n=1 Tax=Iningainema tapete BLCC-T55 TaxID=2748662 RepID=A0A8J6XR21_9CYAN|nr:hypothetical protein [Iningainema tapete]MBD2777671.1 hypothetical protein [Iningainema tapete BLCC-T55]
MTPQQDTERINKDKIPSAIEALRGLDAKELPDVPARVAIRKMRRQIERVLKLGYTYDEVSEVLAGLDIHISGSRLKYLLGEVRKSTRTRKKKADEFEGSSQAGTDESLELVGDESEKNGLEKSQPVQQETQPRSPGKPKAQSQPKPRVQSETPVEPPTVDAASDDYQPMVLRRR